MTKSCQSKCERDKIGDSGKKSRRIGGKFASQVSILSFNLQETKLRHGFCHFGHGLYKKNISPRQQTHIQRRSLDSSRGPSSKLGNVT